MNTPLEDLIVVGHRSVDLEKRKQFSLNEQLLLNTKFCDCFIGYVLPLTFDNFDNYFLLSKPLEDPATGRRLTE